MEEKTKKSLVDNPDDWKNELAWWFYDSDYEWTKERLWLNTMDTGVSFDELIAYIEELIQLKRTGLEGRMVDGDFYLKQPDGKYYSVNSMRYLTLPNST